MTAAQQPTTLARHPGFCPALRSLGLHLSGHAGVVRDMPPYVAGAVRYLVAGPIMLAACALMGRKVRLDRLDLGRLLVISILLLSLGNIGVLWGEEYVSSGLASLIVALVPIWVVMIEAWIFRAGRMTAKGLLGLAVGIVGLLVLLWPRIASGTHLGRLELLGSGILAGASFFWALGSVFSHRFNLSVDVFVSAAWQMTLAGLVNAVIALATGQFQRTHWTVAGAFRSLAIWLSLGHGSATRLTSICWSMCPRRRWRPTLTSTRSSQSFWAGSFCRSTLTYSCWWEP